MITGLRTAAESFMAAHFANAFAARPFVVYDIGASGGLFSLLDARLFPHQKTFGFEPEPREFAKLAKMYVSDDRCDVRPLAIGEASGQRDLYVHEVASISSTVPVFESMTPVEVEASTLDDLVTRHGLPPADFIKIDIEGGELPALTSGPALMREHVVGLVSEIGFWRIADKETRFAALDSFLADRGFILFDLTVNRANFSNVGGKKAKARTGDALYLRNFEWLYDTALAARGQDEARVTLLKLLLVCYHYLYADYALEVAHFGREVGLLDAREFTVLARELATISDMSRRLPRFPGRQLLSRMLDLASYVVNEALKKDKPVVYSRLGNSPRLARRQTLPDEVWIYRPVFDRRDAHKTIKLKT